MTLTFQTLWTFTASMTQAPRCTVFTVGRSTKRGFNNKQEWQDLFSVFSVEWRRLGEAPHSAELKNTCHSYPSTLIGNSKYLRPKKPIKFTRWFRTHLPFHSWLSYEATVVGSCSIVVSYLPVKDINVNEVYSVFHRNIRAHNWPAPNISGFIAE